MTSYKKKLPLVVLKVLEPFVKDTSPLFEVVEPGAALLWLKDSDPLSDFYFKIISYSEEDNSVYLEFKPMNPNNIGAYSNRIELQGITGLFTNWKSYLQLYSEIEIFDDPILSQYQKDFEAEFQLIDSDADRYSFDLNTQIWLDEFITRYSNKLITLENSTNRDEVENIQRELIDLKNTQTRLTKKRVVEKLSKIWALTRKLGLSLINDLYQECKSMLINKLLTGGIDEITKIM